MWDCNHQDQNWKIKKYAPGQRNQKPESWGGPRYRRALHLAYTISFNCLLRVDEALKIQSHEIELVPGNDLCLKVTLPFRKTNQFGRMYVFLIS